MLFNEIESLRDKGKGRLPQEVDNWLDEMAYWGEKRIVLDGTIPSVSGEY